MNATVWRGVVEVLGCHAASRDALDRHARGHLDDGALGEVLRPIERRLAALRATHWLLDALIAWLGWPARLSRPVGWLLLLAGLSLLAECR